MIIGYIGMPGCGKTTIAKILYSLEHIGKTKVEYPLLNHYKKPYLIRNVIKVVKVYIYMLKNSSYTKGIRKKIKDTNQKNIFSFTRVFYNYVFFVSVYEKYKYSPNIIIIDEAFLHQLWLIQYRSKYLHDDKHLNCFFDEGMFSDLIINVDCNHNVLIDRFTHHKTNVKMERSDNIKRTIRASSKEMEKIIKYAKAHVKHRDVEFIEIDNTDFDDFENNIIHVITRLKEKLKGYENRYNYY